MGVYYTVEAKLSFKDGTGEAFCKAVNAKMDELTTDELVGFDFDGVDRNNPFELFCVLCPDAKADEYEGTWYADFHASYGWESVLYDCFKAALPTLEQSSRFDVFPDSVYGSWRMKA